MPEDVWAWSQIHILTGGTFFSTGAFTLIFIFIFPLAHIIWIQKNNTFCEKCEKKVNATEWYEIFLLKEGPKHGRPSPLDILIHGLQPLLTTYTFANYQTDQPLRYYLFVHLHPTFIVKNIFFTNERRVDSRIRNNIPRQKWCDLLSVLWPIQKP